MHQVYRAPMRSRHDDVDPGLAVERALASGVCGVGGRLSTPPSTLAEALARTDDHGSPDALATDLVHVRACDWLARPVPPERVPAATLATFARGGRNFQQTHDATVGADSAALWQGAPPP